MKTDKIRTVLVGVGRHAQSILLPSLNFVDDLALVGVATSNDETARRANERYRLPAFTGHRRLFDSVEADAAIVSTPGKDMAEIIETALSRGMHVFCETPGPGLEACEKLIELSRKKRRIVQVGYCLVYAPIYEKLRGILKARQNSSPRLLLFRYFPAMHHIHHLANYLNGPVEEVLCVTRQGSGTTATARFANGDVGVFISNGFKNFWQPYELVEISCADYLLSARNGSELFDSGALVAKHPYDMSFADSSHTVWQANFSNPYNQLNQLELRGYIPELRDFACCIKKGIQPVADLRSCSEQRRLSKMIDDCFANATKNSKELTA